MENKLNKWFDAARHNPPMISAKEVGAMISNPPAVKGGFSTLTKFIIMGTVMLTIVGWLYWMNTTSPGDTKMQAEQKNQASIHTTKPIEGTEASEHLTKRLNVISETAAEIQKEENGEAKQQSELVINMPEFSGDYPSVKTNSFYDHSINTSDGIQLTNQELAALGINTNGNTLQYYNIVDSTWRTDEQETQLAYKGSFSLNVESHGSKKIVKGRTHDTTFVDACKPFWPAAIQIVDEKNDTSLIVVEHMQPDPQFEYPFFYEVRPLLIPVFVSTKAKPSRYSQDLQYIFWFKPELTFFDVLPAEVSQQLRQTFSQKDFQRYIETARQHQRLNKRMWLNEDITDAKMREIEKRFIKLSDNELEKLNVFRTANGFEYSNNFYANNKVNRVFIKKEGMGTEVRVNDKIIMKPRITKHDKPFMPVALTDAGMFSFFTHYLYFLPDSLSDDEQEMLSMQKFANTYKELVPILVEENTVFWFPETEAFIKALPERVQQQLGVNMQSLNRNQAAPVKYIELTDEQLAKLGITRNLESIRVPMHTGDGKYLFSDYSSKGTVFHFNSITPASAPSGGIKFSMNQGGSGGVKPAELKPAPVSYPSPSLITEGNGLQWLTYETGEDITKEEKEYMMQNAISPLVYKPMIEARKRGEAKLATALNTYVALKVKSHEKPAVGSGRNPDLIIWYNPDSLLFSALPAELSSQIKQELERINQKQSPSACQFFETCQSVKGTIGECVIYPNPASNLFQVRMELVEARRISITLTDISGKKVKDLVSDETQQKGTFTRQLTLEGLPEGMYLLHITTEKGEYIVQRMIRKE